MFPFYYIRENRKRWTYSVDFSFKLDFFMYDIKITGYGCRT